MAEALRFFTHDVYASANWKFKELMDQYGWLGYGRFWGLNEKIGQTPDGELDLGPAEAPTAKRRSHARWLDMSLEEFEEFLVFLRDGCDLIHYEDGVVWTDRVKEDMGRVNATRERKAAWKRERNKEAAPEPEPEPEPAPAPEERPKRPARAARPKPEPQVPAAPVGVPAVVQEPSLHHTLMQYLEKEHGRPFGDYKRAGANVKKILERVEAIHPEDPVAFMREFMITFKRLKASGDRFWAQQPFTPETLVTTGIFDRIVEEMKNRAQTPDASWVDNYVGVGA